MVFPRKMQRLLLWLLLLVGIVCVYREMTIVLTSIDDLSRNTVSYIGNGGRKVDDDMQANVREAAPVYDIPLENGLILAKQNKQLDLSYKKLLFLQPGYLAKNGAMGKAVHVNVTNLTNEDAVEVKLGWKNYGFNKYVSDIISVNRSLPDVRVDECKIIQYDDELPGACVIIIFYNEAVSALLRTVHSVRNRSDQKQLQEIILVDDASTFSDLHSPLQEYIEALSKVRLVRAEKRLGLIRARILGFNECHAQVAVFLDSHCEVTEGWLTPLLARIAENRTNVVVPTIDIIHDETFEYLTTAVEVPMVGGFNWRLMFNWHKLPDRDRDVRKTLTSPLRSPTMAGGLFAIDSAFFRELGTYDPGFDIWGGENLELSFKTWMCGGNLETLPCSHVGHVFRKYSPYSADFGVGVLRRNLVRLAEVWMDDYKEHYYRQLNYNLGEFGNVSDRIAIRKRLHCHDFKWYLENVYPELKIPKRNVAYGEIRSAYGPVCIDGVTDDRSSSERKFVLFGYACHGQGNHQYWLASVDGEIMREDYCWDLDQGVDIKLRPCHDQKGNQEFIYRQDDSIYNPGTRQCVQLSWNSRAIELAPCMRHRSRQKWIMTRSKASKDDTAQTTPTN